MEKNGLVKVTQSCPTLCNPMDYSLPGSSVHGILQARILEWVAMPPPGDLPDPRIISMSHVSRIGRRVLYHLRHLVSLSMCISISIFISVPVSVPVPVSV